MTKAQLNKLSKDELVANLLEVNTTAQAVKITQSNMETVVTAIAEATVQLLKDIDLPRKFGFIWILSNFKEIAKFIAAIVQAIKDAKQQGLIK